MELSRSRVYSRRHLAEFMGIVLFSLLLLNPFSVQPGAIYSSFTPYMIKDSLLSFGWLAPLFMIFLEAVQVLIAPLPPVTMVASGYTFGVFHGAIYSFAGMTLGSSIAILVSRRLGKPVISTFVSEAHLERFHSVTEEHGLAVFTAFFIAPGFPHDILCYIAGLTDIETRKLVASVSLGRLPTLLVLVMTGDSIARSQPRFALLLLAVLALTGLAAVKNEAKLIGHAKRVKDLFWSKI